MRGPLELTIIAPPRQESGRPIVKFDADISDLVAGVIHEACQDRHQAAGDKTDETDPPDQIVARRGAPAGDREGGERVSA